MYCTVGVTYILAEVWHKEKEVVRKNVPEIEGVEALIDLIKKEGDWIDVSESLS